MSYFSNNSNVTLSRETIKIEKSLGAGGQGEVYEVEMRGKPFALKWYNEKTSTPQLKRALAQIANKHAPSKHFLWPQRLLEDDKGRFGYIMDIIPPQYKSMSRFLSGDKSFNLNFVDLAFACFLLSDSFHCLHAESLSYQDISKNNVFFCTSQPARC